MEPNRKGDDAESDRRRLLQSIAAYAGAINRHEYQLRSSPRQRRTIIPQNLPVRARNSFVNRRPVAERMKRTQLRANRAIDLAANRQARFSPDHIQQSRNDCVYYNRDGLCTAVNACPYVHNPAFVAVCPRFMRQQCQLPSYPDRLLQLGVNTVVRPPSKCPITLPGAIKTESIEYCPLSHTPLPTKLPLCRFFQSNKCHKPPLAPRQPFDPTTCPYPHIHRSNDEEICEAFSKGFYCLRGLQCPKTHSFRRQQRIANLSKTPSKEDIVNAHYSREDDIIWFDASDDGDNN